MNGGDENRLPPLQWAASQGHTDVAKVLINAGADVNSQTNHREEDETC